MMPGQTKHILAIILSLYGVDTCAVYILCMCVCERVGKKMQCLCGGEIEVCMTMKIYIYMCVCVWK